MMIGDIGEVTDSSEKALSIVNNIKADFADLVPQTNISAAYIIWNNPIMSVNKTRFIHDMLHRIGFTNVFAAHLNEYPEINVQELKNSNPDVILLSSEPFPFKAKHVEYFREICPSAKVVLVDGELFSWYGSRLQKSVAYFSNLLKQIY